MLKKTATFRVRETVTVSCPLVVPGPTHPTSAMSLHLHYNIFTDILYYVITVNLIRVSDSLCEELEERPDAQEDCNILCPRDCNLSLWSPWSDCPNQCHVLAFT